MSGFHVGQRVVCIEGSYAWEPLPHVSKGRVYTISELIWIDDPFRPGFCLQFEEVRNAGGYGFYPGFEAECFRPLDEKRLDMFRTLLAPRPHKRATA